MSTLNGCLVKLGNSKWIINIAMISEGTDIPRLQVCCSLTEVTTELYFRQILGRILRVTGHKKDLAYMRILAKPNLVEFVERLNKAILGAYNYYKLEKLLEDLIPANMHQLTKVLETPKN
ncbi:hypothetical protein [Marinomonas lutimaris]|uniref:hypothetical protein n=1 Tax=Marinomonas lutimaris TaxID=2846746 RepID=UPI001CA57CFB|nr:hypothetical protein [Marinomonas lutimaris]